MSSIPSRIQNIARVCGWKEVIMLPLRALFSPIIIPFLKPEKFNFDGEELTQVFHSYNLTWANERCIELPIFQSILSKYEGKDILEVGNVMHHYQQTNHDVVDKFEQGESVITADIVEFRPEKQYDLIISISTFEHIGFDEGKGEETKELFLAAIRNCRSMLKPGGELVLSLPLGYNKYMDQIIRDQGGIADATNHFFQRVRVRQWENCTPDQALARPFSKPYLYANGLVIVKFSAG